LIVAFSAAAASFAGFFLPPMLLNEERRRTLSYWRCMRRKRNFYENIVVLVSQ
jgi:hypothetical protein